MANSCAVMRYAWLYASGGEDTPLRLAQALSIPAQHVFSGDAAQAEQRIAYFEQSALYYFKVQGDAAWSCEVQLRDLPIAGVHKALQELSQLGLTIALMNDASSSPFDAILFERGGCSSATLVSDDETAQVTFYRAL